MALLNGIIRKMKGSAGNLTFRTLNGGRTVVSEKITTVNNSRTDAQQRQRMKWVNIIRVYSGLTPLLNKAFEKKQAGQSDYNVFVMLNTSGVPVYLTKTEADNGTCIAAPYQITRGTLPSIEVTGEGADSVTNIRLGSLSITANTTVAEFSQAVVNNNPGYNYGEQISFFDILQDVNLLTGIPYCRFGATEVTLNRTSEVKLWDLVNSVGFASVSGSSGNVLGHGKDEGDGVFAWVHSSYQSGATHVSTQYLIINNSMLEEYTTEEAFNNAANSYGGFIDVFLTPNGNYSGGGNGGSGGSEGSGGGGGGGVQNYTITVTSSNTTMGTVTGGGTFVQGSHITISAQANSGYVFVKWSDNDTNASRSITVTQNLTLTAQFASEGGGSDEYGSNRDGRFRGREHNEFVRGRDGRFRKREDDDYRR